MIVRFVDMMGGHIWIESGGLGKGTTVAFLVKVGECNYQNDLSIVRPKARTRPHQGSGELIKHRGDESYRGGGTASFPAHDHNSF